MSKRRSTNVARSPPPKRTRKKKEPLPSVPDTPPGPHRSRRTIRPPRPADETVSYAETVHDPTASGPTASGILEANTGNGGTPAADGTTPIEIASDTEDEKGPEFTGEVPHYFRNMSITETTGVEQLCDLVQVTLNPPVDRRVHTPSPTPSVTAGEEDPMDTHEGESFDHDAEDAVLHWVPDGFIASRSSSPAPLGSRLAHLKTPGEALVFVLFYVTHSKRYVLTERFTPSQPSPEYAEVLSYMRRPDATLGGWLNDASVDNPVKYCVGTCHRVFGVHDNFMSSMFFMQVGPVESPARGMMSRLPGFATPPAVLTEMGAEAPRTMYVMYIYPQMLTPELLELPLSQESHVNSEILRRSDITMAKPETTRVRQHSTHALGPGPACASSSSSAQAAAEDSEEFFKWLDLVLAHHFAADIQDHTVRKESGEYGTAYMAFLNNRLLQIVYKALYPTGNQTTEFSFKNQTYWIHRHNVGRALIGSSNTANNHMSHISNAHRTLKSLCAAGEDKLTPQDKNFKRHLEALLGETVLGPRSTYRDTSSAEYNAVTMLLGHMNDTGKEIRKRLGEV